MTERGVAVVTGAARGIGLAVVDELLQGDGIRVLAVDRDREGLVKAAGLGAETIEADLATVAGRDSVVSRAMGAQYLVNAAGIIYLAPICEVTIADLRRVFAINVEATWDLTSRLGQRMGDGGAVVNLSSSSAKLANTTEAAAYACSKAAILSITRSFAYAFARRGVRVNAVCPGIIDTPMQDEVVDKVAGARGMMAAEFRAERKQSVPLGRAGSASECARVIKFLLSSSASYMTGQAVNVTGGLVTW
jgi:NAD(P)-dependent dehydrogenase (short-subunit alcohol dehydrogenase family)